jgi:hypothetical protein
MSPPLCLFCVWLPCGWLSFLADPITVTVSVIVGGVQVMGCAMMLPLGMSPDGARVAEIGAFCVDVVFRGTGRGDSLLDYVEQVRPVTVD